MSKQEFELEVSPRTDAGKGASRRLRRLEDKIPAIIYGLDREPELIAIRHDTMLHATEKEGFFSQIITLRQGKKTENVIIKDLQRHPSKPFIVHADFQRISADQPINVIVPLHFINEDICIGVKQHQGQIARAMNELEVTCLPKDLPEFIAIDMANMDIGDSLHLSQLELPEGVTSVLLAQGEEYDQAIVSVHKMQAMETEDEAAEAEEPAASEEPSEEADDEEGKEG